MHCTAYSHPKEAFRDCQSCGTGALRQRDQIDHTSRQETGPEPDLKAQGFLLSRAKQGNRERQSVATMVSDLLSGCLSPTPNMTRRRSRNHKCSHKLLKGGRRSKGPGPTCTFTQFHWLGKLFLGSHLRLFWRLPLPCTLLSSGTRYVFSLPLSPQLALRNLNVVRNSSQLSLTVEKDPRNSHLYGAGPTVVPGNEELAKISFSVLVKCLEIAHLE